MLFISDFNISDTDDEYLGGNTPNRVVILIVIKLFSVWGLEYGPEISIQKGLG